MNVPWENLGFLHLRKNLAKNHLLLLLLRLLLLLLMKLFPTAVNRVYQQVLERLATVLVAAVLLQKHYKSTGCICVLLVHPQIKQCRSVLNNGSKTDRHQIVVLMEFVPSWCGTYVNMTILAEEQGSQKTTLLQIQQKKSNCSASCRCRRLSFYKIVRVTLEQWEGMSGCGIMVCRPIGWPPAIGMGCPAAGGTLTG